MYQKRLTVFIRCTIMRHKNTRNGGIAMAGGNTVQPIRDLDKLEEMKAVLKRNNYRDFMMFVVGINTGLRISDLLKLTVGQVSNSHIMIIEQKTGKKKRFPINRHLRELLDEYTLGMNDDDYLFPSRKGGHIGRVQAYRVMNQAAAAVGLEDIGTHTLRKTFGYHHYQQNKDVAILQQIFNHSSPSITLRYIGINQDIIDRSLEDFCL